MTHFSLLDVNRIYSCSNCSKIQSHCVEHELFGHFCLSLKNFELQLKEATEDEYWKVFLRPLRRYRFELCAAPLPFNHPQLSKPSTVVLLKKHLSLCQSLYPNLAISADDVFSQFIGLTQSANNPMQDFIAEKLYHKFWTKDITLVVKESRLIPFIKETGLTKNLGLRNIKVLMPSQLRGCTSYDMLIFVGPVRWFPEYVFSAPRAPEIQILHYSWIRDKWKLEPVFLNSQNVTETKPVLPPVSKPKDMSNATGIKESIHLEPEDLLLPSIWRQIVDKPCSSQEDEDIEARLFALEGEAAVFLANESRAIVIELEEDGESKVKRIPVADIELGMFILLRTVGGGDYIVPLADRLLGEKAQRLRELQKLWKNRLRNAVTSSSLLTVSKNLVKLGSPLAINQQNIRNWMSDSLIRPHDDKDFNAILQFVGLGEKLNEFQESARLIDSAHRRAGRHISKLLFHQVCNADLHKLEQMGQMKFELDEADGGSMTAFRVVDVAPELKRIPASKVAQVLELQAEINNG